MCCSRCGQLTNRFDMVVQKPWHFLQLSAINNACVRSCHHFAMAAKGKFSPEMDIFYFMPGWEKFWQPEVTLNPQMHITELSGQERWQQRTLGLPCCMRYSSLPCPLASPGNNSVHESQLPLAFFFLLAPGLGMRQQVPCSVSVVCLPVARLWLRAGCSGVVSAGHHLKLLAKTVLGLMVLMTGSQASIQP